MARKRKGKGHELEVLIEKIERAIASTSMRIKVNDMVRDKYGDIREVDISIRGQVGTIDIFLIIECRNRTRVQDKRWVEEVASKRDSLQANKAILVSTSGFYESAYKMAADKGIVLRTVRQITYEDIKEWLQFSKVQINTYNWQHTGYGMQFSNQIQMNASFGEFLVKRITEAVQNPALPIFTTLHGETISTKRIWNDTLDKNEPLAHRLKSIIDRRKKPLQIEQPVPINSPLFFSEYPDVRISQITFLIRATKEVKYIDIGEISSYSERDRNIADFANFAMDLGGAKVDTKIIRHADGKTTIVVESDKPLDGTLVMRIETTNEKGETEIIEINPQNYQQD
jgi:hypothetical protein